MIYLDHAATTPVPKAVADAMYTVLTEEFGNPSAQYPMGQEMHRRVDAWRAVIAGAVGCEAKQLYFTSCGTEGDNWAIRAACWQNRHTGRHIVTTAVEHHAVLNCCQQLEQEGWEVTRILPDRNGDISTEAVLAAVRPDTALVSVMMVNNELGNIYPIADIARGLKAVNDKTLLHTDAVQGFLKIPFSARTLGADFITLSGHKIGVNLLVDSLIRLTEILAALTVAHNDVLHAQILQHIGRNLAGVSAFFLKVDILSAHGDPQILERLHGNGNIAGRNADQRVTPLGAGHDLLQLLSKFLGLGGGHVHFPVAGDHGLTVSAIHNRYSSSTFCN